jgi:hypothetical protein
MFSPCLISRFLRLLLFRSGLADIPDPLSLTLFNVRSVNRPGDRHFCKQLHYSGKSSD